LTPRQFCAKFEYQPALTLIEVGIRTFLRDYPDLQLVHITNDYQILGQLAQKHQPDITLFFTTPSAPSHIHYLTEYYQQNRAPILLLTLVYNRDHFCHSNFAQN